MPFGSKDQPDVKDCILVCREVIKSFGLSHFTLEQISSESLFRPKIANAKMDV